MNDQKLLSSRRISRHGICLCFMVTSLAMPLAAFPAQTYPPLSTELLKSCPEGTHSVLTIEQGTGGKDLFQKSCHNAAGEVVREILTNQSDGALVEAREMGKLKGPLYKTYKELYRHASPQVKSRMPDADAPASKDLMFLPQFDKNGKLNELIVSASFDGRRSEKNWTDITFDSHGNPVAVEKHYSEWEKECTVGGEPDGLVISGCQTTHDVVIDAQGNSYWPHSREVTCSDPKTRKSLRMKYSESADKKATVEVYGNDGASEKPIFRRTYESSSDAEKAVLRDYTPEHAVLLSESPVWAILGACGPDLHFRDDEEKEKVIAKFREDVKKAQADLTAYFAKPNWATAEDTKDPKQVGSTTEPEKDDAKKEDKQSVH